MSIAFLLERTFSAALVFILLGHNSVWGQPGKGNNFKKNTFYLEVATKGSIYSVNYDRIFHQGNKLLSSFRIGFSVEKNGISMPLGINLITGKKDHHAEFSLTVIPYIDHYKTFLSGDNRSDKYLYIIPATGYRLQKPSGGFFFRASVAPLVFLDPPSDNFWKMDPRVYAYGSIGMGFNF